MTFSMKRLGIAFGLLALTAAPARAQEQRVRVGGTADVAYVSDSRARLGVFLTPGCPIGPDAEGTCPVSPVVMSVVDGAPAARAGVLPGDTLVAINGLSLRSETGRRSMARLEEGVAVRLDVKRGRQVRELSVMPTARPAGSTYQVRGTTWTSASRADTDVQVYRFPDGEGGVSEFRFAPRAPELPGQTTGYVVFSDDVRGDLRVDFGRPNVEVLTLDGEVVELAELEMRLQREGAVALRSDDVETFKIDMERPDGEIVTHRLILENAPLARRLESLRAHTLTDARVQLDSIVRVRAELARRGELPPMVASTYSYVVPDAPPPPVGGTLAWTASAEQMGYRLAGAEFRVLTPELAEYFSVDTGLLVLRVIPETPAGRLGLRGGDVVVEVGGRKMPDVNAFRQLVAVSQSTGSPLAVKWNRKGRDMDGNLTSR